MIHSIINSAPQASISNNKAPAEGIKKSSSSQLTIYRAPPTVRCNNSPKDAVGTTRKKDGSCMAATCFWDLNVTAKLG